MTPSKTFYVADFEGGYYINPVFLFKEQGNIGFPSRVSFTSFFDIPLLIEGIKKFISSSALTPVSYYCYDKERELQLQGIYFYFKHGFTVFLDIGYGQIIREYEDTPYFTSERNREDIKRAAPTHFRADLEFYYDPSLVDIKEVEEIINELKRFKVQPKRKSELKFLCMENGELTLKALELTTPVLDIELNYGKGFGELYSYICDHMSFPTQKGLVLFHGLPGTGKTFLIRKLINDLSDKKQVIYIPPDMVYELSSPKFLPFLIENQNSILVIEDGENVIKSRRSEKNQAVANLLNVADGLLSDALNTQILCTFNCKIGDVDDALLRKGRLIAQHEFKELSTEDSQTLLDSLKIDFKATKPMTLADIYNCKETSFKEEKKGLGFTI